jgi:hypothetical protein
MKKYLQKINKFKLSKKRLLLILPVILIGLLFIALPAQAADDWANKMVANILGVFITGLGFLLTLVIRGLIYIASFSTFLDSGAVSYGWVLVRDICNMFFVVILLLIAFGTILNIEKYNYKKWLPKLILMAILINFSKTICGLFIDIAQVVMLTFVNAFASVAGGNMVSVLGIDKILTFDTNAEEVSIWTVVSAYLLGIIYLVVALIVISTMMIMLVIRVVMIWIYVVLSPLAYLLAAFPGGQSYSTRWWTDFTKNLIVGPVLAFFIWLSFAALQADEIVNTQKADQTEGPTQTLVAEDPNDSSGATEAATPAALIKFVIAIGMFVGGLKIAQEVGGAAGSVAGKGMNAVNKAGKIGMGGLAAATGYRAAKKIGGNYMAARKKKREDKYSAIGHKMSSGVDTMQNKIGQGAQNVVKKIPLINNRRNKAKKEMSDAKEMRKDADQIQNTLQSKRGKIGSYSYDKVNKDWVSSDGKRKTDEDMRTEVKKKSSNLEKTATKKEESAKKSMRQQKRVDKSLKLGLVAAGFGFGGIVGGAGAIGAVKANKKSKDWANNDKVATSWRMDMVKDEKNKLKDRDDEDVLEKMDNQDLSKFERAAASLEAMERDLISSDQASNKREEIKNNLGGDKNGEFKDKKLGKYFDRIAKKSYVSSTQNVKDLNLDPSKEKNVETRKEIVKRKEEATEKVSRDVEKGKMEIKDVDLGGFSAELAKVFTNVLSKADFNKQFSDVKDKKVKGETLDSLSEVANEKTSHLTGTKKINAENTKLEAKKKIASVTDLDTATGYSKQTDPVKASHAKDDMKKILHDFDQKDINEPFAKNNDKMTKSIEKALSGLSNTDKINVFNDNTKKFLIQKNPAAQMARNNLGISLPTGSS